MSDASGFGQFVPGFEFLQNLASQAAGGVAQGLGNSLPQMPNLGHWVAPTFNVEELDKRIQELKAVHFWLDQNSKALAASIQALEVQKMTLTTLKNMNVSFGEMADALKMPTGGYSGAPVPPAAPATKPTAFAGLEVPPRTYGAAPAPAPEKPVETESVKTSDEAPSESGQADTTAAAVPPADPLLWWGALAQQFQQIASHALQEAAAPTTAGAAPAIHKDQAAKEGELSPDQTSRSRAPSKRVQSATGARKRGQAAEPRSGSTGRSRRTSAEGTKPPAAGKAKSTGSRKAAKPEAQPLQSLSPGNWALPSAMFPLAGFQAAADAAAASLRPTAVQTPAPKRSGRAEPKAAARKTAPRRR